MRNILKVRIVFEYQNSESLLMDQLLESPDLINENMEIDLCNAIEAATGRDTPEIWSVDS